MGGIGEKREKLRPLHIVRRTPHILCPVDGAWVTDNGSARVYTGSKVDRHLYATGPTEPGRQI